METQESPPVGVPSTGLAQAVLWLCGACYLVLGLGLTPTAYFLFTLDPEIPDALAEPLGIGFAVVLFVVGVTQPLQSEWELAPAETMELRVNISEGVRVA